MEDYDYRAMEQLGPDPDDKRDEMIDNAMFAETSEEAVDSLEAGFGRYLGSRWNYLKKEYGEDV